jgi:hypothetical protein
MNLGDRQRSVGTRMGAALPDFATHYYFGGRRPFQNLSDLDEVQLAQVLCELEDTRRAGAHRRVFGRRYMQLRRLTERRLYDLFLERGGWPERSAPHYLILGTSRWYKGLARDMREIRLSLTSLPDSATSFTYPDSITAMAFGPRFGLPYEPRPYHERVFRLKDLRSVVERFGVPTDDANPVYDGYERRPFEKYIELQLWSDAPIASLLGS